MHRLLALFIALLVAACGGGTGVPPAPGSAGASSPPGSQPAGSSQAPGSIAPGARTVPASYTGTVDHSVIQDGKVIFTGSATGVKWQLDQAASEPDLSAYKLVAGSVIWKYDLDQPSGGCGVDTWRGQGTEQLVPDEAPNNSIEGGLGDVDEMAQLAIAWVSGDDPGNAPIATYTINGVARLHDKVVLTYCGGTSVDNRPDYMHHLPHWIEVWGADTKVGADNRLAGTAVEDLVSINETWTWSFIATP